MVLTKAIVSLLYLIACTVSVQCDNSADDALYLFNFTNTVNVGEWVEQSDTVRTVGMSEATITLHENVSTRRAVYFFLLNPQTNGAGFAGVRSLKNFNLTGHTALELQCRGQGEYTGFKVVLRHRGLNDEPNHTFEQFFQGPKNEFAIISLPLSEFKPYYRGQIVVDGEALDVSQVSSIGLQMYGGVYESVQQKGPATLETDWIRAV